MLTAVILLVLLDKFTNPALGLLCAVCSLSARPVHLLSAAVELLYRAVVQIAQYAIIRYSIDIVAYGVLSTDGPYQMNEQP